MSCNMQGVQMRCDERREDDKGAERRFEKADLIYSCTVMVRGLEM